MIIVTAADSHYFTGLLNLIGSVHFWSTDTPVLVYDLGLIERQKKEIHRWKNTSIINSYLQSATPSHCNKLKHYAWKAIVLHDAIERDDSILWIDAGSDLRSSPKPIFSTIRNDGHFFVQGQDLDMTQTSAEATYSALKTTKASFSGQPHFSAGLQGYQRNSTAHKKILNPLYTHSLDESCIAPPGSNIQNHRYDQTLLSILIYQCGYKISPKTQWLAAARSQLHDEPMQPSKAIVYTARNSSIDYIHQVRNTANELCYTNK